MTIRFRRSLRLLFGVSVHVGKHGVGVRHVHVTVSDKGMNTTVGILDSGLSSTEYEPHEHPVSESPDILAGVSGPEPRGHAIIVWIVILGLIGVGYFAMH